ncbi:MAG: SIMPL domain-containing protein [Proteobacteria bacterium]|nr:SIMPL domain-containing protein [Pseudomonadota bacterium]
MRIMLAAIIAALASGEAAAQQIFDRPYWLDRSVIEAIGRAQVDVTANRARFSVTFQETAHEAQAAQASAADRARLAVAAMRRVAPDATEISSEIEVNTIQAEYRDHDGNVQQREGAQNIAGYVARVTLSVRVLDTRRASDIRAAAFAVGPEDSVALEYYLDQSVEQQRRAYTAAVEDAVARARAAATAAGSHLGPLLVLQEGQGPCMGSWDRNGSGVVVSGTRVARQDFEAIAPVTTVGAEQIVVTGTTQRRLVLSPQDIARLQLPDDQTPVRLQSVVCVVYATAP